MEIGKVYIIKEKGDINITLDKVIDIFEIGGIYHFESNYITVKLSYNEGFVNNPIKNFDYISIVEYLENPEKYGIFYKKHETILKMWNEFLKHDIVEARKFKLKLLEQ